VVTPSVLVTDRSAGCGTCCTSSRLEPFCESSILTLPLLNQSPSKRLLFKICVKSIPENGPEVNGASPAPAIESSGLAIDVKVPLPPYS
jgi:hypothetical protein